MGSGAAVAHRTGPTPEVTATLAAAFAAGATIAVACAAARISPRSYHRWLAKGRVEIMRVTATGVDADLLDVDDPAFLDEERRYVGFARAMDENRARQAAKVQETLVELATVGVETRKVVRREGHVVIDGSLVPIDETTTTTERKIDPTTVRWLAERLDPDAFHLAHKVELTQNPADTLQARLGPVNADLWTEMSNHRNAALPAVIEEVLGEVLTEVDREKLADALQSLDAEAWSHGWQVVNDRHGGPARQLDPGDPVTDRYRRGGA